MTGHNARRESFYQAQREAEAKEQDVERKVEAASLFRRVSVTSRYLGVKG